MFARGVRGNGPKFDMICPESGTQATNWKSRFRLALGATGVVL